MADILSRKNRSDNMAKIKSRNTSIEIRFRKQLYCRGIRYAINYPAFGKPDITLVSKKIAIFVNGCFWHQHRACKLAYMPKTNIDFWSKKLNKNIERDRQVNIKLKKEGWHVIRVWECEIENDINAVSSKIIHRIQDYAD